LTTAWQILLDGFAVSALYALGATGFALIFGVSGILNLSHGALMVGAAVIAWGASAYLDLGSLASALVGIASCVVAALLTFYLIVKPLQRSRAIPKEEKEIFILTGTLLWGILIQELLAYVFTSNVKAVKPLLEGVVEIAGVRVSDNELLTTLLCWLVIGFLWQLINHTTLGKVILAASMNARAVTLLGFELASVYLAVWIIYGLLAGIAGVLLGMFLGVSSYSSGPLMASAFTIVVLGGLGSVTGAIIAAYAVGYLETMTAYLVSPAYRTIPTLMLLVVVMYLRPQGLLGRR
jgi:branched-chain amino acid transport system permease protein